MTAGQDRALWRSFAIFGALPDAVLDELPARSRQKSWRMGEMIFQKGDTGDFLLAVTDGRIKLFNVSSGGRELLIRVATPGDLVGEIATLDGSVRSSTAAAATPVTAFVLARQDYRDIATRFPILQEAAIGHLCALLRDTNDRVESISLYQLRARLARFLLFTLKQVHGPELDPEMRLTIDLNQSDLGLLVGASRPKLNGILNEFREQGYLVQEGAVWRCDVVALRDAAEE